MFVSNNSDNPGLCLSVTVQTTLDVGAKSCSHDFVLTYRVVLSA